jgi:oxygen-independent coproporphyrinogen-3 oxidase
MKKLGLYVHIPFCERKCNYCDFYSLVKTNEIEDRYVHALLYEIKSYKDRCSDYEVDTVFIGGGTPSYLKSENIKLIMQEINNTFLLSNDCEITIEANPNSIDKDKALQYKSCGINRISLGIQSLDDNILKFMGRLHDSDEAINAIRAIKEAGINNINVDIMFGIPSQTIDNIINSLSRVIKEDIEHISFYSLKLEEGTPMYSMEKKGLIKTLDDDDEREMYYAGRGFMEDNGYTQYEISNFSKASYECKHNIKYWTGGEYIGFGPFAHSCFEDKRYNNISDINIYCNNINNSQKYRQLNEILNKESKMFEYIMLGLRMNKGISIDDFDNKFEINFLEIYKNQVKKLLENNLITLDKSTVKLSKRGMDISNYVFEEFM